jgi:SAM-dependent methyltransferase
MLTKLAGKSISLLSRLVRKGALAAPPTGAAAGLPRQVGPVSTQWGYDRGSPVDRYYIEKFLALHAGDIRGRVLEIGDSSYTRRFGASRVTASDVLDVSRDNPAATVVADLTRAEHIPSLTFDCIILTQTLQFIYDVPAALRTLHRILKPAGVLLATVPGITRISHTEWTGSWYWSFTTHSAWRLCAEVFPPDNVRVESHGNVFAASAFLYGLAAHEVTRAELDFRDLDYQLIIAVRAAKA